MSLLNSVQIRRAGLARRLRPGDCVALPGGPIITIERMKRVCSRGRIRAISTNGLVVEWAQDATLELLVTVQESRLYFVGEEGSPGDWRVALCVKASQQEGNFVQLRSANPNVQLSVPFPHCHILREATQALIAEQYVRWKGVYCPYCGSDEIEANANHNLDGANYSQEIECNCCSAVWDDCYTLTGFSTATFPEPIDVVDPAT